MHLAYYEEHDYHTEIAGLFLDYCYKNNHSFDYFNDKDQSYFIEHYERVFEHYEHYKQINKFKNIELIDRINDYDYVIVGTMGFTNLIDALIKDQPHKFVQVYHNDDDLKKIGKTLDKCTIEKEGRDGGTEISGTKIGQLLVLTPLLKKVGPYTLPIFNAPVFLSEPDKKLPVFLSKLKREKIVTMVGRFTNHRSYESLFPLLNMDYTVWLIARRPKFVPNPLVILSKTNPKLKISYKLDAQKMSEVLSKSMYILCIAEDDSWYYKDRLTGTIPLAYNYNLPIIIPSRLNDIYDIKGSVPYSEPEAIPGLIEEIDKEPGRYENMMNDLINQKEEIVRNNRDILSNILKS